MNLQKGFKNLRPYASHYTVGIPQQSISLLRFVGIFLLFLSSLLLFVWGGSWVLASEAQRKKKRGDLISDLPCDTALSHSLRITELDPAITLLLITLQKSPAVLLIHDGIDSWLDVSPRLIGCTRSFAVVQICGCDLDGVAVITVMMTKAAVQTAVRMAVRMMDQAMSLVAILVMTMVESLVKTRVMARMKRITIRPMETIPQMILKLIPERRKKTDEQGNEEKDRVALI